MTISINEFRNRISRLETELYLLACTELLIYDNAAKIVYIPVTTHHNTNLNPMGDFRTYLGHGLLWSQHVEVDCESGDLYAALSGAGYNAVPYRTDKDYQIFTLVRQPAA